MSLGTQPWVLPTPSVLFTGREIKAWRGVGRAGSRLIHGSELGRSWRHQTVPVGEFLLELPLPPSLPLDSLVCLPGPPQPGLCFQLLTPTGMSCPEAQSCPLFSRAPGHSRGFRIQSKTPLSQRRRQRGCKDSRRVAIGRIPSWDPCDLITILPGT